MQSGTVSHKSGKYKVNIVAELIIIIKIIIIGDIFAV